MFHIKNWATHAEKVQDLFPDEKNAHPNRQRRHGRLPIAF